jgi:hypothetical protein
MGRPAERHYQAGMEQSRGRTQVEVRVRNRLPVLASGQRRYGASGAERDSGLSERRISTHRKGTVRFTFSLQPHETWHLCVDVVPFIDGEELPSQYRCRSFATTAGLYDLRRQSFLRDASTVSIPVSGTLAPVVVNTLERAKRDLAALRLHDFDHVWREASGRALQPVARMSRKVGFLHRRT